MRGTLHVTTAARTVQVQTERACATFGHFARPGHAAVLTAMPRVRILAWPAAALVCSRSRAGGENVVKVAIAQAYSLSQNGNNTYTDDFSTRTLVLLLPPAP